MESNKPTYYSIEQNCEIIHHPAELYIRELVTRLRTYYKKRRHSIEIQDIVKSYDGLKREFMVNVEYGLTQYNMIKEREKRTINKQREKE